MTALTVNQLLAQVPCNQPAEGNKQQHADPLPIPVSGEQTRQNSTETYTIVCSAQEPGFKVLQPPNSPPSPRPSVSTGQVTRRRLLSLPPRNSFISLAGFSELSLLRVHCQVHQPTPHPHWTTDIASPLTWIRLSVCLGLCVLSVSLCV